MIDDPFREKLPKFVQPLLAVYKFLGLTPNMITLAGLMLSGLAAYLITLHLYTLAIAAWWIGRLFDGTDGIYARRTKQNSDFGAHLDILSDMAAYSLMIVGFSLAFPSLQKTWVLILFLYVLCITGALSLGSLEEKKRVPSKNNRGLRLATGIAEGGETGIAYSLFLLFPKQIEILSSVWVLILGATVLARLALAKREL